MNDSLTQTIRVEHYYSNGAIREINYHSYDGLLNGNSTHYHRNGKIAIECSYINGMKQGIYFEYDEEGTIIFSAIFDKDQIISYIKFK